MREMATQGVLSVIRGGRVTVKVVTGCNGMEIPNLAAVFREKPPETAREAYDAARACNVGCESCLVVMDDDTDLIGTGEPLAPRYRATRQDPTFNPRWDLGTADYVEVVTVPETVGATP